MKINNTAVLALLSVCTLVMTSCSDDKKQESAPAAKPEAQAEAKPEAEVKEANPAKELAEEMIVVLNDMADVIENLTVENAQEQIAKLKDIKAKADAMEAKVAALTPEQMKEVEDDETVKAAVEKAQTRIENAMAKMQEEGNEALALIMIAAMAGEEMPDMEEETPELPEVEPVEVDVEDEEPAAVEEEAADVDVDVVDEEPAAEEEAAEMEEDLELVDDTEEDVEDEEEAADAEEELELDEEPAEDEELDLEL